MRLSSAPDFLPAGSDTTRSTTALAPLGMKAFGPTGEEFRYVKAGAAIALYDAVRFQGSALGWDDIRPTSAANQVVVGAATAAFDSGAYGFIQTKGVATVKVVVATTAGVNLVSNGTAGTLAVAQAADTTSGQAVALVTGVAAGSAVALL
jgi:hypothetical protein